VCISPTIEKAVANLEGKIVDVKGKLRVPLTFTPTYPMEPATSLSGT
jgi:hypothetical protein